MHTSYLIMGSLVVDVNGPVLDAKFLDQSGVVQDYFTITKIGDDFRITAIQLSNGDVLLRWASIPGRQYQIEYAPSLSTAFTPVSDSLRATGTSTTWTHELPPGAPLGFYRAHEVP